MTKSHTNNTTGILAVAAGAAGIGFAPIFVRWSELGPFATAAYRMCIAAPFLWMWCILENKYRPSLPSETPPPGNSLRLWLLLAGIFFAGDMALWNWSLHLTTVTNSTLITNLTPLFVMLIARTMFGERMTRYFLFGLPFCFLGVLLLVASKAQGWTSHWKGDFISGLAIFFYAGYLLALRKLRLQESTARILAWSGVTSAILLFVIAGASGERLYPKDSRSWGPLAALALISHVGGQGLIGYGFGHVSASLGSLLLLIQPVVAAVLSWMLLGEKLTAWQGFGAVLVLIGLGIATRRGQETNASSS